MLDEFSLEDHTPTDDVATGLSRRSRRILWVLTALALLGGIVAAVPWWGPFAQQAKNALFPPPPYTGSLIYSEYAGQLTALRTSDGGVQWTQHDVFASSQFIATPTIIVLAGLFHDQPSIAGVQPRSGRLMWLRANPSQYASPYFAGVSNHWIDVWFPSPDGVLPPLYEVLNAQSGTLLWSDTHDGQMVDTQVTDASPLVFCTFGGPHTAPGVVARDAATGAVRWQVAIPGENEHNSNGMSCYRSGTVIILEIMHSTSSTLRAYRLADGTFLWQAEDNGSITGWDAATRYTSTSARFTGLPAQHTPILMARDSATGHVLWQVQGDYTDLAAFDPFEGDSTSPVYFAKSLTGMVAFASQSGTLLWHFDPPDDQSDNWLAVFDGDHTLYYFGQSTLYVLNAGTGQMRWHVALPLAEQGEGLRGFFADRQHAYLLGSDGITARDAATGQEIWHSAQQANEIFP